MYAGAAKADWAGPRFLTSSNGPSAKCGCDGIFRSSSYAGQIRLLQLCYYVYPLAISQLAQSRGGWGRGGNVLGLGDARGCPSLPVPMRCNKATPLRDTRDTLLEVGHVSAWRACLGSTDDHFLAQLMIESFCANRFPVCITRQQRRDS